MRLKDKKALVTGASSGIGYASAVRLAEEGADVAVTYCNNKEGADKLVGEIEALGRKALCVRADMTRDGDVTRLADEVGSAFGGVDVLFNNAGGLVARQTFMEVTRERWNEIMDLNVWSLVLLTQKLAPGMKARGGGAVINNASVAGRFGGGRGALVYGTAKGAVITLTQAMARELIEEGIRVNAIAPGIIDTPFHDKFTPPEVMSGLMQRVPIGRPGTSREMADIVVFLACEDSGYLVGATIDANGGMWVI